MTLDDKLKTAILRSDDAEHLEAMAAVFAEASMLASCADEAIAADRKDDAREAITRLCELVFPLEDALISEYRKLVPLKL